MHKFRGDMKFICFCLTTIVCICLSQRIGNLVYVTRWHYVGVCDHTTTVAVNGSSQLYQTFEVWNGIVNVTQDLILDKVLFLFLKCAQGYYACERFLTVKVDKNLKDFLYAKQAGWATLWKSLHPQPKLPYIHKGIYTVTNLTIDVNLMLTMIPEFADYSWIIKCIIYDKKDNQQACGEINLHIVKYTHRDRDRKRKRKN